MFGIEDTDNDFFADWSALCNENINILKKETKQLCIATNYY